MVLWLEKIPFLLRRIWKLCKEKSCAQGHTNVPQGLKASQIPEESKILPPMLSGLHPPLYILSSPGLPTAH